MAPASADSEHFQLIALYERDPAKWLALSWTDKYSTSGKTYTVVSSCYRLIKFARARRALFLVDRNNLGRQTLAEFQKYGSPYTNRKSTEEYTVQHLRRNALDPSAKIVVTAIQRLYSMLRGEEEFLEENEEGSLFETENGLLREPVPVGYNPALPVGTFDFIVVDECHRSIYNLWRQVLDYFDAFIVGLTATPTAQTLGFFNQNLVQDYSHEKAVADGVNVGYDVYRIETRVTRDGVRLARQPGVFVPRRRTEFLVGLAAARTSPGAVVLDLCCGSGALGAALAAERPGIEAATSASDASRRRRRRSERVIPR